MRTLNNWTLWLAPSSLSTSHDVVTDNVASQLHTTSSVSLINKDEPEFDVGCERETNESHNFLNSEFHCLSRIHGQEECTSCGSYTYCYKMKGNDVM